MRQKWNFQPLLFIAFLLIPITLVAGSKNPEIAKQGMVVSDQALASEVGVEILRNGGNAIDAAVAVGYALAVVQPCCGNIGGGGFMTIRFQDGKTVFLNFREHAPLAATANMYLDEKGDLIPNKTTEGYLAVGVPGTVLGLETVLKKYGTLSRQAVMAPAIHLAETGFVLVPGDVKILSRYTAAFKRNSNVAAIFLKNNKPYEVGERLIQSDLAKTLKLISSEGPKSFYEGPIAEKIVSASQEKGGIISLEDFKKYEVSELQPLECTYRGNKIITAPPPSSGGILLCEMLNILEGYPLSTLGFHSAESTRLITEAMRNAYADLISLGTHSTTHYSVVDKIGNIVSVTYTLNGNFGAEVIAKDTGFFLNNEMDDFTAKIGEENQYGLMQGTANLIEPGKQPLSSMTPTIIINEQGQPFLVLGAVGGSRIITAVLQTLINVVDYKLSLLDAVNAPRFHHQHTPGVLMTEPNAFTAEVSQKLTAMGYQIQPTENLGIVEAILIDSITGQLYGASDMRRSAGKAIGY